MAITLSLALNMRRMLKSNNLVRKLHACETMGAVTVICTDKTGTLTQNKMQVSALELKQGDEALLDTAIALNSTAELNDGKPIGNPTESALLLWLDAQGKDYEELRKQVNVLKQLPFSTERKMMATLAEVDGETYLFVKGAPEIVMKKCIIEDRMQRQSAEELDEWQHKAMRTLAFAYKKIEASIMRTSRTSTAEVVALLDANDLQLQAIAAITDPIRPDVPAAVQECRHAGIEVKVVTGDTAATALEIGKQIGVFEDEPENIGADGSLTSLDQQMITGEQWEALSDEEAYERAKDIRVIIIKLADRLHNMRTLQFMTPAKQKEKAKETMDIYAPIAQRLGISKIKTELDDLALKYSQPEVFNDLVKQINARKTEREEFVQQIGVFLIGQLHVAFFAVHYINRYFRKVFHYYAAVVGHFKGRVLQGNVIGMLDGFQMECLRSLSSHQFAAVWDFLNESVIDLYNGIRGGHCHINSFVGFQCGNNVIQNPLAH